MKRLVFFLVLFLVSTPAWAATKYARAGGGNWSADATWSTTSGGAADTTKCVATDDCKLDANSGNVTVDVASAAKSLDCTGYTGTLTLGANLTVSGNLTLVSGMTFTPSTYTVIMNGVTSTVTSGGKEFYGLTFLDGSTPTYTLVDNITVNGTLTINNSGSAQTITMNSNTLIAKGDIATGANNRNVAGTTTLQVNGSGNQNVTMTFYGVSGNSNKLSMPFEIKSTGGTVTIAGDTMAIGGTWTHTSGTVSCTGTIRFYDNASITSNTMTFNNVQIWNTGASKTMTLNDKMTVDGNLSFDSGSIGAADHTINGNIDVKGNISTHATNRSVLGTGTITMVGTSGTSTISFTGYLSAGLGKNFTINSSNTIQFGSKIDIVSGIWTYTAATAVDASTNSSTIDINGSVTLNTDGIDFYNISHNYTNTTTLSSALTATNLITLSAATTFSGAHSITTNNLTLSGGATHDDTLSGDLNVTGDITVSQTVGIAGSQTINLEGDLVSTGSYNIGKTTAKAATIIMNGSDDQTLGTSGYALYLNLPLTVNKPSGDFILASGTTHIGQQSDSVVLTYTTADALVYGTSTLSFNGSATVTGAWQFYNVKLNGNAKTLTISNDITVNNTLSAVANMHIAGAYNIHAKGNVDWEATVNLGYTTADATLLIDGTGNQTLGNASYGAYLNLNTTVNKASGNFTLANTTFYYAYNKAGITFTYTAADAFVAGTSVFTTQNNANLNFGTAVLYDLQVSRAGTATLTGNMNVSNTTTIDASRTLALGSNTLTVQGNVVNNGTLSTGTGKVALDGATATQTFSGNGITFYDFEYISAEEKTVTWASTKTYAFTNSIVVIAPYGGSTVTFNASTPDSVVNFNISGTQQIERITVVDNDASAGDTGHNYHGDITDAENVNWDTEASCTPTTYTTAYAWVG